MLRVTPGGTVVTKPGLYEVRAALGRLGAPYGQYLQDDVVSGRVEARLFVMLNAWRMSAKDRRLLESSLRGKTVVWCYAPGYFEEDRPSLEAMKELTGFELVTCSSSKAWATPTEAGRRLGLHRNFGTESPVRPLFAAAASQTGGGPGSLSRWHGGGRTEAEP